MHRASDEELEPIKHLIHQRKPPSSMLAQLIDNEEVWHISDPGDSVIHLYDGRRLSIVHEGRNFGFEVQIRRVPGGPEDVFFAMATRNPLKYV
jgi:hypothetical protein